MNQIIKYFIDEQITTIQESPYTWDELGAIYDMSGEAARACYRRGKDLILSSIQETLEPAVEEDKLPVPPIAGAKIKSVWQSASGKWMTSYKVEDEELLISKDDIKEILSEIKIEPVEYLIPEIKSHNSLIVYTSDKHIGASGTKSNPYDANIFKNRMLKIAGEVNKLNSRFNFDKIHICDMGDSLDGYNGQTTRGGHSLEQSLTNKEMFKVYQEVHQEFLAKIVQCNSELYYTCLSNSNHDGDFGWMAHETLRQFCELKYPQMNFNVVEDFFTHFSTNNNTFILCHGKDDKNMSRGMPLHLNPQTESIINQYILSNQLTGKLHLIKGDLHLSASEQARFFRYKNVASVFGTSGWIEANFGYTKPACDYDILLGEDIIEGKIQLA